MNRLFTIGLLALFACFLTQQVDAQTQQHNPDTTTLSPVKGKGDLKVLVEAIDQAFATYLYGEEGVCKTKEVAVETVEKASLSSRSATNSIQDRFLIEKRLPPVLLFDEEAGHERPINMSKDSIRPIPLESIETLQIEYGAKNGTLYGTWGYPIIVRVTLKGNTAQ